VLAPHKGANMSITKTPPDMIKATGTLDNTTFLRGDGAWAVPGGGAWEPIESQTVSSSVASVDFTTGIDDTFDEYAMKISGANHVNTDSGNAQLWCRFRLGSGGDFLTAGYFFHLQRNEGTTVSLLDASADTQIELTLRLKSLVAAGGANGWIYFSNMRDTAKAAIANYHMGVDFGGAPSHYLGYGGMETEVGVMDGIQIRTSSPNLNLGTYTLWGLAKS